MGRTSSSSTESSVLIREWQLIGGMMGGQCGNGQHSGYGGSGGLGSVLAKDAQTTTKQQNINNGK